MESLNDVVWVNKLAGKKMLNNKTFNPETVYPAHSQEDVGFIPYINKNAYDKLARMIKENKEDQGHGQAKK